MTPTESEWTREVISSMKRLGCYPLTLSASKRQQNGVPDRYVAGPGIYSFACWLEFKGARTQVRLDQKLVIRNLRARDRTCCYVVRYPGRVEDEVGALLAAFDGTGLGLMKALKELGQ